MHLQSDEAPLYTATFSDGYASLIGPSGPSIIDNPVSANMFTTTFDISDSSDVYTAWGYAIESTDEANQQVEGWLDYAPGSFAPWYDDPGDGDGGLPGGDDPNGGDGNTGNGASGTPGFELIVVIAAIGVAFILLKRKK